MDFRLEFDPPALDVKIDITDKIMLVGSCFTDHMFERLHGLKFSALQNPNGVLFNPQSIFHALKLYLNNTPVLEEELFCEHGLWHHWDFHSSLSHSDKKLALQNLNEQISNGHDFLKSANWLILTMGSAFVYSLKNHRPVANCHKVPATHFNKKMLAPEQIKDLFALFKFELEKYNPALKIILTVSPVRHLRDGFVENNRSKASLIHATDLITQSFSSVSYFPSYELIIDDLRDYRFYAEDMVHPNYLATKYVWQKFRDACINGRSKELIKEIELLNNAMSHRAMHPESEEHNKFKMKFNSLAMDLQQRIPHADFLREIEHFS
jgi:hypothetical protein